MNHDSKIYLAILLMSTAIYTIRLTGFWFAGFIQSNVIINKWIDYLPGTLLTAIVTSALFAHPQVTQLVAAVVTVFIMIKTKNIFLSVCAGISLSQMMTWFMW